MKYASTMRILGISAFGVAALAMTATCGKKSKKDETAAVTNPFANVKEGASMKLSGQLALANSVSSLSLAPALSDLLISCVTFTKPPVAGEGAIAADGKFSLTLAAAKTGVGCFVVKGTGDDQEVLATLVFKDNTKKGIDGDAKSQARQAFGGDTDLGAISLDLDKGVAIADVANFKAKIVEETITSAQAFDFTGNWTLTKPDFALPKGYLSTCVPTPPGEKDCEGAPEGMVLNLRRYAGKRFEPDATCTAAAAASKNTDGAISTCGGKTTADNGYAVALWESEAGYKTCGSVFGHTDAEIKGYASLDLTANHSSELKAFAYNSDFADGWKYKDAVAQWDQQDCSQVTINKIEGWKCSGDVVSYAQSSPGSNSPGVQTPTGAKGYNVHIDQGCKDASGNVLKNVEWSKMDWSNSGGTSTDASAEFGAGYTKNVSTPSYDGTAVTCTNIGGQFDTNGTKLGDNLGISPTTLVAKGAKCDSIETGGDAAKELAKLRCYANAFHDNRDKFENTCLPEVNTNWQATKPEDFVIKDKNQPKDQFILQTMNYLDAGTATFTDDQERYEWIQTNGSQGVACRVFTTSNFTIKKVDDSKILFEIQETMKNLSQNLPACVDKYGSSPVQKLMFYGVKK